MTAIRVLQSNIEKTISELGSNTFQIQRWPALPVDDESGGFEKYLRRKDITLPQAMLLKARATLAKHVSVRNWLASGEVSSRFGRTNPNINASGVTPESFETLNWIVEEGRPFNQSDLESARAICVLGNGLAKKLFPMGSALGERVKFKGIHYTVVGVLEPKGSAFNQDQDNFLAIPITTALNRFGRRWSLEIQVQAHNQEIYDDTLEQVRGVLRTIRKVDPQQEDDFDIFSNDSMINTFRSFTLIVRAAAGVISSIALLAAGIGIMNIMLVSVTERTREIGIRRAVGAKKRNIMSQFILEAIALCQIGGILGVILAIAGGNIAAYLLKVTPVIPVDWIFIGLGICSLVGIIFGTYPAYKAANLDPIDSLRYE